MRTTAALANERAAKEEHARAALVAQFAARDFTAQQMDDFVARVNAARLKSIAVFTLQDPEAFMFGQTILQGLQRAGVSIAWYNVREFNVGGVSETGVTIYERRRANAKPKVAVPLMDAFIKAGVTGVGALMPEHPGDQINLWIRGADRRE